MCGRLGVTYGYISLLRSGQRNVEKVSDSLVDNLAGYLGVPKLQVMLVAGKVKPADLFMDPPSMGVYLSQAIQHMRGDPVWGPYVVKDVEAAAVDVQFLCVQLFQAATGKVILPQRSTCEDIAEQARQLAAARERLVQDMHLGHPRG